MQKKHIILPKQFLPKKTSSEKTKQFLQKNTFFNIAIFPKNHYLKKQLPQKKVFLTIKNLDQKNYQLKIKSIFAKKKDIILKTKQYIYKNTIFNTFSTYWYTYVPRSIHRSQRSSKSLLSVRGMKGRVSSDGYSNLGTRGKDL